MPPLPPPLGSAFLLATSGGGKSERTQAQLLHAAVTVICERGLQAGTMQQVAQAAGVTTATLYNHFSTKEALIERLATTLARTLCRAINDSYGHITDAAERMAIGQRRYVALAAESPAWALLLLDVMNASPAVLQQIEKYPLSDLRLGVKQKKFSVPSEAIAMDTITGVCSNAMRRVALGQAPARHDSACAAMVLRALGVPAQDAAQVAARPLPPLGPEREPPPAQAVRKPRARTPPRRIQQPNAKAAKDAKIAKKSY